MQLGLYNSLVIPRNPLGFSAASLGDLGFWLRADKGVTVDGSDRLGNWTSQGGMGGFDPFQLADANKPVIHDDEQNGHPIVRFDGVNDVMHVTGDGLDFSKGVSGTTIIAALKFNLDASARTLFNNTCDNYAGKQYIGMAAIDRVQMGARRLGSDGGIYRTIYTDDPGVFGVYVWRWDYANALIYSELNGTELGLSTAFQTSGNAEDLRSQTQTIAASTNGCNVDIGQMIGVREPLSSNKIETAVNYMMSHFNVA